MSMTEKAAMGKESSTGSVIATSTESPSKGRMSYMILFMPLIDSESVLTILPKSVSLKSCEAAFFTMAATP